MKIALYGKDCKGLKKLLLENGAEIVEAGSPQCGLLICYGGDGALLRGEMLYPGIPKMPVRDVETAPHCAAHSLQKQIELLLSGSLHTTFLPKLSACYGGRERFAINDIFIHNLHNYSALRYQVKIDENLYAETVVGDGVGVSTVHGSTGYYRSITHGSFRSGIGLAFSNSTELINHKVLQESCVIKVRILRGPGELVFDNSPETLILEDGDVVTIRQSEKSAEVLGLELFMCPECRRIRRDKRRSGYENVPF